MEFRTGALACPTAGAAASEAAALHAVGMGSITGIAPHALAPPPFSTYHNLRSVFVSH